MKKIFSIFILIFLHSCSGYTPIYTSSQSNFYINQIEILDDNKLTRKIIKNLKPYSVENGKRKIDLKLNLLKQENVIMKDAKGDPASFEIKINLNVEITLNNEIKKLDFQEKFTFNNQSNKFELNQYKKNMEESLLDKIFESLIMELKSI